MIKKSILFFLFFSLPALAVGDTVCSAISEEKNIQASTPTSQFDFEPNNGDVVTDKKTGLMWTRCPMNYHWALGGCIEDSFGKISWESALTKANNTIGASYLLFNDWRVPNIKELASIVERKCAGFAINHEVFGGAGSGVYWSNSHTGGNVRVINMDSGQITTQDPGATAYVRLVRDCQSLVGGVCQD